MGHRANALIKLPLLLCAFWVPVSRNKLVMAILGVKAFAQLTLDLNTFFSSSRSRCSGLTYTVFDCFAR